MSRSSIAVLGVALAAAALLCTPSPASAAAPRVIKITGTDAMRYSVTRIEAKPGETLKVELTAVGKMPKSEMAHNFNLLKKGVDPNSFVMAGAMARNTDYFPERKKDQVIAHTGLAGAGETVEVTFDAPKEPGEYTYLCTYPGHYAGGMKGVLVVK
jgi:azurin